MNKFRRLIALQLMLLITTVVFAQFHSRKYAGPGNWFLGVDVGTSLAMNENVHYDDFYSTYIPSASVQIGYAINPWISLRTTASVNPQLGHASDVALDYNSDVYSPYRFAAFTSTFDFMLNLTNCFRKFDSRNGFDLYLILGGGYLYSFGFEKKVRNWSEKIYPVDYSNNAYWCGKAGLEGAWHLNRKMDLVVSLDFFFTDNKYNGVDAMNRPFDFFLSPRIGTVFYLPNRTGRNRFGNPKKPHRYWKELGEDQ